MPLAACSVAIENLLEFSSSVQHPPVAMEKNAMMSPPQIQLQIQTPKFTCGAGEGSPQTEGHGATTSTQETELDGKIADDNI